MVLAGQYLERPAPVAAGDATLDALYHRGRLAPSLLVCPDPRPGGGMDTPVCAELAWAAARAGHASLRFDWRGTGASSGAPDPARAVEDASAALQQLEETAGPGLAVAGCGAAWPVVFALLASRGAGGCGVLIAPDRAPAAPPPGARILVLLPELGPGVDPAEVEAALGPGGRVALVPDADPRFRAGLPALGRTAIRWVERG